MKDFPLTQKELKAALSSRYWNITGLGTKKEGLWPSAKVAQLRGLSFVLDQYEEYFQPIYRTAIEDAMADHALYDVAKAFGFRDQDTYLDALGRKGVGVKTMVLKRLKRRGIAV